ncbi:MAG TPA: cysteine desulfurase family protein [Sphingobium sp.]|uniref:cysteine desulfurase family protein n=1 Tax=Sphingobium sp. TaxID=1912891 RepID=UPI002ED62FFB
MTSQRPVYLDYHAHAPLDPRVAAVMHAAYMDFDANPHSTHLSGEASHRQVELARLQIADMLQVSPSEVIFTSGATESNNLAIHGLASHLLSQGRTQILVSAGEHPSVLAPAHAGGLACETIALKYDGTLDLDHLSQLLDRTVGLVSVAAANHEIGTIQPLDEIADRVRAAGALFHSDLAQAAGKISVSANVYDLASVSAHKMGGPSGIGALIVRRRVRRHMRPIVQGGGQENGLRPGTLSTALCVAFGEAARIAMNDAGQDALRVAALRDMLLERLQTAGGLSVHGSPSRLPGNLNIAFEGVDGEALVLAVRDTVSLSTGSACTSRTMEPSHVLRAIGLSELEAQRAVRCGLGRGTTEEDVNMAADAILGAVKTLRATWRRVA